jgi:hypothetical protein
VHRRNGWAGRRGAFAGSVDRRHQGIQEVADLAPEGAGVPMIAVRQALRLPQPMCPAAQPAGKMPVGAPAIRHQPAGKSFQKVVQEFPTPAGDVVQGDGGRRKHPKPPRPSLLRPRGFIAIQQATALDGRHLVQQPASLSPYRSEPRGEWGVSLIFL